MSPPTLDASHALPNRRWFPPTRTALDSLLTWLQQQDAPQVAVFDWDSTSIQGDIGGEFGRYQIATLQLRGTPDDFGHVWQAPPAGQLLPRRHGG